MNFFTGNKGYNFVETFKGKCLTRFNAQLKIVLICFSCCCWRLNHQSRVGKGSEAITFDKKLTPFSYFVESCICCCK